MSFIWVPTRLPGTCPAAAEFKALFTAVGFCRRTGIRSLYRGGWRGVQPRLVHQQRGYYRRHPVHEEPALPGIFGHALARLPNRDRRFRDRLHAGGCARWADSPMWSASPSAACRPVRPPVSIPLPSIRRRWFLPPPTSRFPFLPPIQPSPGAYTLNSLAPAEGVSHTNAVNLIIRVCAVGQPAGANGFRRERHHLCGWRDDQQRLQRIGCLRGQRLAGQCQRQLQPWLAHRRGKFDLERDHRRQHASGRLHPHRHGHGQPWWPPPR